MPLVGEMIRKLQAININQIVDDSIREIEDFILELNKDQLYERGEINVNNPGQRAQYAEATKRLKTKSAKFKKVEFVTLRWTGDMYDTFKIVIFDKEFIITSQDMKWAWLEGNPKFTNALGLTEESKGKLRDEILPVIIRRLKDEL